MQQSKEDGLVESSCLCKVASVSTTNSVKIDISLHSYKARTNALDQKSPHIHGNF